MARNRGKKALYEVMSKARARQGYGKTLEQMHPKKTEEEVKVVVARPKPATEPSKAAADWWTKPRIAQFIGNSLPLSFKASSQAAGRAVMKQLVGTLR